MLYHKIGTIYGKLLGFTLGNADGINLLLYKKYLSEYLDLQKKMFLAIQRWQVLSICNESLPQIIW